MKIWNEVAPRYHKRWARNLYGPFQSTTKLVEHVDVQKGFNVLDVACGTGVVTKKIKSKSWEIWSCDWCRYISYCN